jgi:hypothetical protein
VGASVRLFPQSSGADDPGFVIRQRIQMAMTLLLVGTVMLAAWLGRVLHAPLPRPTGWLAPAIIWANAHPPAYLAVALVCLIFAWREFPKRRRPA